jgi:hypothetical protein
MIEILKEWFLPDGWLNRIYILILLSLFSAAFYHPYNAFAISILDKVILIVPVLSALFFYLLLYLGLKEKAYYLNFTDSTFWYGSFFLLLYWSLGLNTDINYLKLSKLSLFVMYACYFIETLEYDHRIRKYSYEEITKQEQKSKYFIPTAHTMSYFPKTVGEFGLLAIPLLYIPFVFLKGYLFPQNTLLIASIVLLLFPLSTTRLAVYRRERLFISFVLIHTSFFAFLFYLGVPKFILFFDIWFLYLFILYGLSLIYCLNTTKQYIAFVTLLGIFMLASVLYNAVGIFGVKNIFNIIVLIVIPLLAALVGTIFTNKLSLKLNKENDNYYTPKEITNKLGISLDQTYKLDGA